jgi:hypothetical protein
MSITLTRQELYDRVCAEPVDTLAKEFGLSNVGLGKPAGRHMRQAFGKDTELKPLKEDGRTTTSSAARAVGCSRSRRREMSGTRDGL